MAQTPYTQNEALPMFGIQNKLKNKEIIHSHPFIQISSHPSPSRIILTKN
jgi:hypothetical protein